MIRWCAASLVLAALCLVSAQDSSKAAPGSLTLEDVLSLSKDGVAEDVIIARVKHNAKAFDLNSDEIKALKNDGVSDTVIKYLMDPSQPYSPAPPPAPVRPGPPAKPPSDPLALKVPEEVGIYYWPGKEDFVPLDLKPVVLLKEPGKASKFSGGLVKEHVVGAVIGATAKARVQTGAATFYARPGEKAAIEDFVLRGLELSDGRRNVDFGTKIGKPVFPTKSVHQFEPREVMQGVYRIAVPSIGSGKYLFFLLGSGDEKKGLLGKGYDFGINEIPKHK